MQDTKTYKCSRCKEHLDRSRFGGFKKRNAYCFPCAAWMNNKHRVNNRDRVREQNNKAAAKRYKANRENLISYLNDHPCVDCGEADIVVLEFDHRDPTTKRAKVADTLGSWKWDTIMTEIDKCDVRCANCHRRRTSIQFGWFKGGGANDTDQGLD